MKPRMTVAACVALLFSVCHLRAQESAGQRHEMATNQLKRIAAGMSARCLSDIQNLDDWKQQRLELRRQLLEMLGLDPLPARTSLKVQITGRLERDAYRMEKVVFQSLPGLYVTGNLYLPNGPTASLPTILYLCGHSPHLLGAKFHYQDRAIWFASHGYVCLVLDTLEFGEVAGIHHGTHDLNMWHWLALGYTPAGVEVWNAIRALDYLETRPEVDPRRIGLTGISGGGAMTWYTAAVDERVGVAAPVCSTFTFGSQADHWLARGQCDCIYYHNTYSWDFPIVGALIAPRPLILLSGQKDTIFPPDGYHEAFQRAKKVYDLYAAGDSDRIREVDDNVEHSDAPLFLREARQWMQRWLKVDATPLPAETDSQARVTEEERLSASSISLYGKEEMGIVALGAALFDERIGQVILSDPPGSHWQRPALLNVLRVTDVAEVAGALAPRRLVSLTKLPESFDYTKRIYGLQRASNQFVQSASLPEALEVWKHSSADATLRTDSATGSDDARRSERNRR